MKFLLISLLAILQLATASEPNGRDVPILVPQQQQQQQPASGPISHASAIWTCDVTNAVQAKYAVYCEAACGAETSCRINKNSGTLFCQCEKEPENSCSTTSPLEASHAAEAVKCDRECEVLQSDAGRLIPYYCPAEKNSESIYCACAPTPYTAPSYEQAPNDVELPSVRGPLYDILLALAPVLVGPLYPLLALLTDVLKDLLACALNNLF